MYYPLFLDLTGKKVLVAGGGRLGTKRAITLKEQGAEVTVVSRKFSKELDNSGVELIEMDLLQEIPELDPFFMLITATDNKNINDRLAKEAQARRILVNRADKSKEGDVIFPMTSRVKGHVLAYTTLGEKPALLKRIKRIIEDEFSKNKA